MPATPKPVQSSTKNCRNNITADNLNPYADLTDQVHSALNELSADTTQYVPNRLVKIEEVLMCNINFEYDRSFS